MFLGRKLSLIVLMIFSLINFNPLFVLAEEAPSTSTAIQEINDEIAVRKAKIEQINTKIDEYQKKIDQAEAQQASLANEIDLLDNRVAKSQLEIESTDEEIKTLDAEMRTTDVSVAETEEALGRQRATLQSVLREIRLSDKTSVVDWIFSSQSFSQLFNGVEKMETVHADLEKNLQETKETKISLQLLKQEQERKLISLEDLQKKLEKEITLLEEQKNAKASLIAQTAQSESEFQSLLQELQAEDQYVNRQIASLQYGIEQKLKESDSVGDSSVLSWPVSPDKGISATFHDPTYPFRHLFEHPGLDIPVPVGTAVKSSAPGYVAWVRLGNLYGNYVLIIHADGVATLYAHLSKILVSADQFVMRDETIGLSGGRPGMPGAGLSTGPHLHFEVRKDGIPTNPLDYLVSY